MAPLLTIALTVATLAASPIPEPAGAIDAVKSAVTTGLKDPSSAQLGPVVFYRDADNSVFACGTVNAKNSLGGYVGMTPFYVGLTTLSNNRWIGSAEIADHSYTGMKAFGTVFPKCSIDL